MELARHRLNSPCARLLSPDRRNCRDHSHKCNGYHEVLSSTTEYHSINRVFHEIGSFAPNSAPSHATHAHDGSISLHLFRPFHVHFAPITMKVVCAALLVQAAGAFVAPSLVRTGECCRVLLDESVAFRVWRLHIFVYAPLSKLAFRAWDADGMQPSPQ